MSPDYGRRRGLAGPWQRLQHPPDLQTMEALAPPGRVVRLGRLQRVHQRPLHGIVPAALLIGAGERRCGCAAGRQADLGREAGDASSSSSGRSRRRAECGSRANTRGNRRALLVICVPIHVFVRAAAVCAGGAGALRLVAGSASPAR